MSVSIAAPSRHANAIAAATFDNLEALDAEYGKHAPIFSNRGYDYGLEELEPEDIIAPELLDGNPWYVRGALAVLCGRGKSGKSTLLMHDAAKLSAKGYRVLIVQREDAKAVVASRLVAMGADLARVRCFQKTVDIKDTRAEINFDSSDVDAIINVAEQYKPDFIVVDPLHGLAQGDLNKQSSADCIPPLLAMCQRLNCVCVGALHPGKEPRHVESAISGSQQWSDKARSYIYLETSPDDPNTAVAQQVLNSYGPTMNRMIRFKVVTMRDARGTEFTTRIVDSSEPTEQTAQEYLDAKNIMAADPVDPDEKPEIADWLYETIHDLGNHAFARTELDGLNDVVPVLRAVRNDVVAAQFCI